MAFLNIFKVLLVDDDGTVFARTTLTDADIDVKVDTKEIKGGEGNDIIGILHSGRDIDIKLTDPVFRYDWLARSLGQSIVTGAGVGYAMPKWYTAVTGIKITVDETPLTTGHGMKIFKADGTEVTGFTISSKDVTFPSGVVIGDKLEVRTYKYNTSASTQTITIDNKIFAKGTKCIMECLEIDGDEKPVCKLQYQFDRAVPTGNFAINTKSEKGANGQSFELKIMKPSDSDVIGRIMKIPVA